MGTCGTKQSKTRCKSCGLAYSKEKSSPHRCILKKPVLVDPIDYRKMKGSTPPSGSLKDLNSQAKVKKENFIKIKMPVDQKMIRFKWMKETVKEYPNLIGQLSADEISCGSFQQKLAWFRINLQKHRISWQDGHEVVKVDRWNLLFSSIQALKKLDLYKQVKIQFNDQKVQDAGGLLRQWMHLCVKEIFSQETAIFKLSNTDETAYHIKWDRTMVDELVIGALHLLGLILGKAIFQRISLNCFLDRSLLRQLCMQPVHLCDIYSYDKELYKSWNHILEDPNVDDLGLDCCVYHTHGDNELQKVDLLPDGQNVQLTNDNKNQYLTQIIHLYATKNIEKYVKVLRDSLHSIVPGQLLSIFEPHELQMIINGPSEIDLDDWKKYTAYEGYTLEDDQIKWFWELVEEYGQIGYSNLLHYCTGSTRVPILGFKYLQSNRGEIRQFTIRKVTLSSDNPYPKSHTCFNRLELPEYESKQDLEQRLKIFLVQQFSHYGLD